MDPHALAALICPNCAADFPVDQQQPGCLRCATGHSFDTARQGYVNLLTGHGTAFTADTAAMVEAREAFLTAGHYEPLASALAAACRKALADDGVAGSRPEARAPGPLLLDAGTGTGYYLEIVRRTVQCSSIGLDISKFALRRAARHNPETISLVWDVWQPLPLAAGTVDLITVVFAPRNPDEFARVLKPGGAFIVVTPLPDHLAEIAAPVGLLGQRDGKRQALEESLAGSFLPGTHEELRFDLSLSRADVRNVALMGPAGHHLEADELDRRIAQLPGTSGVTAAVRLSLFRKRPAPLR